MLTLCQCRPPRTDQSGATGACERCIKKGLKDCKYLPVEQGEASNSHGLQGQIQDEYVCLYPVRDDPVANDPVANRQQYPSPNLPSSSSGGYTPYYTQAPSPPLGYYQQLASPYPGPQIPYSPGYPAQPNHQSHLPVGGYPSNMSYQAPVYYDPKYRDDHYYKSTKQ